MGLPNWLLILSSLLLAGVLLSVLAQHIRLPLTALLAIVGFLAGWIGQPYGLEAPLHGPAFEHVVAYLFLPILIFEAAFALASRAFFRNLLPILALALPGLAIAAGLIGLSLNVLFAVPLAAALLFGVMISATDPVAVVGIFRRLGVPKRLLILIEGESLLNDGIVVVLFNILLAVALGATFDLGEGLVGFLSVFFGGLVIGAILGLLAALILPWLDRYSPIALSLALAYGSFVLAEHVLAISGVMATVGAGIVVGALAPTRASAEARKTGGVFWVGLAYVANVLLFLLIGLAIDPALLVTHGPLILAIILIALIARTVAVVPLVYLVQRLAGIPPVGWRNEAVLIWGGLRGGIALALALSLPETLPERDLFIAMTGGVVLATLLINATSIGRLVERLGLTEPSRADRFLTLGARLTGIAAAQERLRELSLREPIIEEALEKLDSSTYQELIRIELTPEEEVHVAVRRGLAVERQVYQRLSDAGLLPAPVARTLLHEVDDQIEEVSLDRVRLAARQRHRPWFDHCIEALTAKLPPPAGEDAHELAYAEASARRLAARRTLEALDLLERLPNMQTAAVRDAKAVF
ncbi:hypothetical protein CAI21_16405 [Alkalilimnicola ehrlichii]|uniref:Cation/H+ exchanger transmembrane domain-containing protein n=1 Tax=Alkalilimnicola ehrlichii TaxID=351052 RepID=A0A3E0WJ25_9GAMM|nr:cation:proton antiporter [Alkalilimnicola ehrlichii]RFA26553.1 hypothetical protein CAI21_16405 [Alkalilimnicola ehrlichii]RFA32944.1 hypothetical protein CAL65_18590 [Alkalilimnicola ehrlichii]